MQQSKLGKLCKRKRELQLAAQADENVKYTRPAGSSLPGISPYFVPISAERAEGSDVRPTTVLSHTAEKQIVCPPLPKSRFLTKDEVVAPAAALGNKSGSEVNNANPLPPPNMDYLTRKPLVPLKWRCSNSCSGFVLEDNTVFFVGTRKYEKAIRQSFLHYLRGGEGDLDDYLESLCADNSNALKERCNPAIVIDEMETAFPTKESSIELISDSGSSSPSSVEESKTCATKPLRTHPAARRCSESHASNSSGDEDLPRVQVTGLPTPAKAGSSDTWKTIGGAELQSVTGSTRQPVSSRGALSCERSNEQSLLKCPICDVSFPTRISSSFFLLGRKHVLVEDQLQPPSITRPQSGRRKIGIHGRSKLHCINKPAG